MDIVFAVASTLFCAVGLGVGTVIMRSNLRANERLQSRFLHEMKKLPAAEVDETTGRARWSAARTVAVEPTMSVSVSAGPEPAWAGQVYALSLGEVTTLSLKRIAIMNIDALTRALTGSNPEAVASLVKTDSVRSALAALHHTFGLTGLELTHDGTLTVTAARFGLSHDDAKRFGDLVVELGAALDAATLGARAAIGRRTSGPYRVSGAQGTDSGSPVSIPVEIN